MARLALELGSEFVYNVIITDYETGLEHEVKVSLLSMHLIYFEIDFLLRVNFVFNGGI